MNLHKLNGPRVKDSNELEQFVMGLLLSKKKKCPKTGLWEIKGGALYNEGKKVKDLSSDITTAVKQIMSSMESKRLM